MSSFWAWGFSSKEDVNQALQAAIARYQQIYHTRPSVVHVRQADKLLGIKTVHNPYMAKLTFYFPLEKG